MAGRWFFIIFLVLSLAWSGNTAAFRTCAVENSAAFAAATHYIVGEIAFDGATGHASGTETTYNHSNRDSEGFSVCHITYELSGVFEPVTGTFLLDANRTSHSLACPDNLITVEYPNKRSYVFQIDFESDGSSAVRLADNGELLAQGDWSAGKMTYRTAEDCTVF